MVGWNHQLSGHEFEQTPGENERQGSLTYCSPTTTTTMIFVALIGIGQSQVERAL